MVEQVKTSFTMTTKIYFSTVALLLITLVRTGYAGCKDQRSFVVNSQTHNCYSVIDVYGVDTVCGHPDLSDWCCKSCKPAKIANKKMKAEGLFVLDKKSIELFTKEAGGNSKKGKKQVEKDALLALTDVNNYYDSLLAYGLDIEIYVADLQILDFDIVSGRQIKNGDVVNEDTLIDTFKEWLQTSAASLPDTKYDFAMLLTGYNIEDPVTGYATLARMCQKGKAYGIVEFQGLPDDAFVIAHEIGHILGASHDPEGYKTVMAASGGADLTLDKYKFSDVSANYINNYLSSSTLASDCLFKTSKSSELASLPYTEYSGNSQDINYLCERYVGAGSTPCLDPYFYKYGYDSDGVCRQVFCRALDPQYCMALNPPEGLPCGSGKSCSKGKCVKDPRSSYDNVDPKCPLGEDPMPTGKKGETCKTLVGSWRSSYMCSYYGDICCETC